MSDVRNDLARTTLSVLFIVALLGASVGIVRPFLLPAFWAATLVIALGRLCAASKGACGTAVLLP